MIDDEMDVQIENKTYSEVIAELLLNEEIELYNGESIGSLHYSDEDVEQKTVIRGIVRGASGPVLILEVKIATSMETFTSTVYVHGGHIKGIVKVSDRVSVATIFDNTERLRSKR